MFSPSLPTVNGYLSAARPATSTLLQASLRWAGFAALFVAHASAFGASPPSSGPTAHERLLGYRESQVLVVPRTTGETAAQMETRLAAREQHLGFRARRVFRQAGGVRVIAVPAGGTVDETVARLSSSGEYAIVERDRLLHTTAVPNDPRFADGTQWSLSNTGQNGGVAGADIGAPAGWNTRSDASSVVVALVDSGARLTHEDLAGNLWHNPSPGTSGYLNDTYGIDAIAGTGLGDANAANDADGHGTHVAGIVGAVGNNGRGIAGVAWKAQLMVLRFIAADGTGSSSDVIECLNYAVAQKNKGVPVRVINASFGAPTPSTAELIALTAARNAGIIFVTSAGNDGANLDIDRAYPASYPLDNIVSVASSDRLDSVSTFSDYGSGAVDLAAPGEDIASTYHTADNAYAALTGTSMAAPHVTGALALLAAQFPAEDYRQLINRLLRSVDHKNSFRGKVQSGGRLNLATALTSTVNRPFNDDFADRPPLTGETVWVRNASPGATAEPGEPSHAGQPAAHSLWWSWTAPASGPVRIDTVGSGFDTVLEVYTGSALGALTSVASDDDSGGSGASRANFTATGGTAYQIVVDGKGGATGLVILNVGLTPANDTFASPSLQSGSSWGVTATNALATKEVGEPNHAGQTGGHSLWYRWTAPASRAYTVSVFTTNFDPVVAVYTGAAVNALTSIAANNNAPGGNGQSLATFTATAGQSYVIAVDGVSATDTGQFTLSLVDSDWQYVSSDTITSSPAVGADGTIYCGTFDGHLVALRSDGSVLWTASTGPIDLASPAIGPDGTVYCGDNNGVFRAFTSGGSLKWQYTTGGAIPSSPALASDGTVYFRADDNYLYALTSTGSLAWKFNTAGSSYSSPAVAADGTVYVGSDNNTLYAVNPNGTQKWAFAANGAVYTAPALAADGTVYAATLSGRLYAVRADGSERWHFDAGGGVSSSPVLGPNGAVYFGAYDGSLYAVDAASGGLRWTFATGDQIRASAPVVAADGTVYLGSYDHSVHAVSAAGAGIRIFATGDIVRSSPVLAGGRLYFGSNDNKLYAIPVASGLAGSDWPLFRQNARRTGRREITTAPAPTIVLPPAAVNTATGARVVLTVLATTSSGGLSYQWRKNGIAIPGATGADLALNNVTTADAGSYTVVVDNGGGSPVVSPSATVSVDPAAYVAPASRLINISTRAQVGTGGNIMIAGVVVGGSGAKRVLIRAVGPALGTVDPSLAAVALANPSLEVTTPGGAILVASNDDWGNDPAIAAAGAAAGAFPLPSGSKDAAVILTLPPGLYTAQVKGVNDTTGVALVEIYDLDTTAAARLINISTRAQVRTGAQAMIAGFAVAGSAPRSLLIRAVGPALAGVDASLAGLILPDPQLDLKTLSGTLLSSNDNWDSTNGAAIAATAQTVGAFAFPAGSKDSALLAALSPGLYTPTITDKNGASGLALVEVYEAP